MEQLKRTFSALSVFSKNNLCDYIDGKLSSNQNGTPVITPLTSGFTPVGLQTASVYSLTSTTQSKSMLWTLTTPCYIKSFTIKNDNDNSPVLFKSRTITITYTDNTTTQITTYEYGVSGGYYVPLEYTNPNLNKKVKTINCETFYRNDYGGQQSLVANFQLTEIKKYDIKYNTGGNIILKFSKNNYSFFTNPTVAFNYNYKCDSALNNIVVSYSFDNISYTDKTILSSASEINSFFDFVGNMSAFLNKDLYIKLVINTNVLDSQTIITFSDIIISGDSANVELIKNDEYIAANYFEKSYVASNYMSMETVSNSYISKSEVDNNYTKTFLVTNISASNGKFEDRVELKWLSVSTAIKYNVYRSIKGDNLFVKIANIITPYYFDKLCEKGIQYEYYITAVNASNAESEPSIKVVGLRDLVITYPLNIYCSDGIYADKVVIRWDENSLADRYKIYRKTVNQNDDTLITIIDKGIGRFEDVTAIPGTVYLYYIVSESDKYGSSIPSSLETGYCGVAKICIKYGRFLVNNGTGNLILHDIGIPK